MDSNLEVNVILQFVVMVCGAFSLFSLLFSALSKLLNSEIESFNLWISKIFITKHWESHQERFPDIWLADTFTAIDQSESSRKLCPERLDHLSWIQIQSKLLEAQKLNQMCIHKEELSELDVHNRKSSILCSKIHALELFSLKDCDADHVTSFTGFAAVFLIAFRIVHIDDDLVLHRCRYKNSRQFLTQLF